MNLEEIKNKTKKFYKENYKYIASFEAPENDEPYIMGIGANTFFVSDGESSFMIDAYATRNCFRLPIRFKHEMLLANIESKPENVEEVYKAIGAPKFSHILCTHNHFDHTLDLRAFYDLCEKYHGLKPTIVGTLSSVNTALGYDVPKENTLVVKRKKHNYDSVQIGKFKITFLPGKHLKLFKLYKSTYQNKPLKRKGFITAYKEGGVLDFLIEHEKMGKVLLTSSFGIGEYKLNEEIQTLIQAVGGASKEKKTFKEKLYSQNAQNTGAKRVLLSHYDNFLHSYHRELEFINVSGRIVEEFRNLDPIKEVGFLKLFEKIKL